MKRFLSLSLRNEQNKQKDVRTVFARRSDAADKRQSIRLRDCELNFAEMWVSVMLRLTLINFSRRRMRWIRQCYTILYSILFVFFYVGVMFCMEREMYIPFPRRQTRRSRRFHSTTVGILRVNPGRHGPKILRPLSVTLPYEWSYPVLHQNDLKWFICIEFL